MTLPEVVLWGELRKHPSGLRFRRQHPAGPYVLDFFCPSRRLAIEIDGEAHDRGYRPEKDKQRDDWLAANGVRTLRIPARDVLCDLDSIIRHIEAATSTAAYPSTSFAGPPRPPREE